MCFLLVVGKFIELLSVVVVGITDIFGLVGDVVGLRCRRLCKGFAELSYESRNASVQSVVAWCLRRGSTCCVVGARGGRLFLECETGRFVHSLIYYICFSLM